jgi:hypothetical protein
VDLGFDGQKGAGDSGREGVFKWARTRVCAAAAIWLASFRRPVMLSKLAEATGVTMWA